MQKIPRGLVGIVCAMLLAGCGGAADQETTFPTTPPVSPPEADQMKSDMMKRAKLKTAPSSAHRWAVDAEMIFPCRLLADSARAVDSGMSNRYTCTTWLSLFGRGDGRTTALDRAADRTTAARR